MVGAIWWVVTQVCLHKDSSLLHKMARTLDQVLLLVKRERTLVVQVVVHLFPLNSNQLTLIPPVLHPTMPLLVRPQPLDPHSLEEVSQVIQMSNNPTLTLQVNPSQLLSLPIPTRPPQAHIMVPSLNKHQQISILHPTPLVALAPTPHPTSSNQRHQTPLQVQRPTTSRTMLLEVQCQTSHPTPTRTTLTTAVVATLQVATPILHPTPTPRPTPNPHFPVGPLHPLLARAPVPQS